MVCLRLIITTMLIGLLLMGCSNPFTVPAFAGALPNPGQPGQSQDLFPVAIWADNAGVSDSVWMVDWDIINGVYERNLIDSGALQFQWTPQRNGVAYDKGGTAYWCQIDNAGVMEVFQNGGSGWQIDNVWNVLTNDSANIYGAIDVESRPNVLTLSDYIWICGYYDIPPRTLEMFFCDTTIPAIAPAADAWICDFYDYSLNLDDNLAGIYHIAYMRVNNMYYHAGYPGVLTPIDLIVMPYGIYNQRYPSLISDFEDRLWYFHFETLTPSVSIHTSANIPWNTTWNQHVSLSGTVFTKGWNWAHNPTDDTIHGIIVDKIIIAVTATYYISYYRRVENGWVIELIDTWSLSVAGFEDVEQDIRLFPQITTSPSGLMIYNIEFTPLVLGGDLHSYYLNPANMHDPVQANWLHTVDVDASNLDYWGACAPEYWRP